MIITKNTIKLGAIRQFAKTLMNNSAMENPVARVRLFSSAVRSSSGQIEVEPIETRGRLDVYSDQLP